LSVLKAIRVAPAFIPRTSTGNGAHKIIQLAYAS